MADAARFWLDHALALRQPGCGIAGFTSALPAAGGSTRQVPMLGLIFGATGIALALLAATSADEPCWDGILLLSNPEREAPT
jgi:lantibiotic biosynthesis protein